MNFNGDSLAAAICYDAICGRKKVLPQAKLVKARKRLACASGGTGGISSLALWPDLPMHSSILILEMTRFSKTFYCELSNYLFQFPSCNTVKRCIYIYI